VERSIFNFCKSNVYEIIDMSMKTLQSDANCRGSVGAAARCRVDGLRSLPVKAKSFNFSAVFISALESMKPPIQQVLRVPSSAVKRPICEANEFHLVQRCSVVEHYVYFPIHLNGVVLN
jgi:hypothetical protein